MRDADRFRPHFGPYQPPALKRGDRAFCLARNRDVIITGWSDAVLAAALGRVRAGAT